MAQFPALALALALIMLAALAAISWIAQRERALLAEFSTHERNARSRGFKRFARPRRYARFAQWRRAFAATVALAMIGGLTALSACHHAAPNPAIETTPEGTTTMNIMATTQGASRGVTITLQVIAPPPGP